MRGKKALLYKNDSQIETVNSHDAGVLVYKGVRMLYFEELDLRKQLNLKVHFESCSFINRSHVHV